MVSGKGKESHMTTKPLGAQYKIKDGKIVFEERYHNVSHRIKARKSKRQQPISRAKVALARAQKP